MKCVTLGVLLALWLNVICWIGLYLLTEATYNLLDLPELTQTIFAHNRNIHGALFIALFLGAVWRYFFRFRTA